MSHYMFIFFCSSRGYSLCDRRSQKLHSGHIFVVLVQGVVSAIGDHKKKKIDSCIVRTILSSLNPLTGLLILCF